MLRTEDVEKINQDPGIRKALVLGNTDEGTKRLPRIFLKHRYSSRPREGPRRMKARSSNKFAKPR